MPVCYTIITEREGKPTKPERETKMYGLTGYECFEGDFDTMYFDTMEEMMEWLEMFEIFDLADLTEIEPRLWTM